MISIVVPTVDIGMLAATLPGWLREATQVGEVIVVNGSDASADGILNNFYWLRKNIRVLKENGHSIIEAMYQGYCEAKGDIIIFLHDDVFIHARSWDAGIEKELRDYEVGVVGFGGCSRLEGTDGSINCAGTYYSNWDDAEYFGKRITERAEVAHLDGHCLAIRKDWLPKDTFEPANLAVYDAWFSCLARSKQQKLVCLGIRSYHTSWLQGNGNHVKDLQPITHCENPNFIGILPLKNKERHGNLDYGQSRKYLFSTYKHLLPIEVV